MDALQNTPAGEVVQPVAGGGQDEATLPVDLDDAAMLADLEPWLLVPVEDATAADWETAHERMEGARPVYDERGNVRPRGTEGARPMTLAERKAIARHNRAETEAQAVVPEKAKRASRRRSAKA